MRHGVGWCLACLLLGCSAASSNGVAAIQNSGSVANRDFLLEVAQAFYQNHPDEYDMLVVWSAAEFSPGYSFYLPVKNDVPGIGYENQGAELFDDSAAFGSSRLQGIIWMGPDWIANEDEGSGPRSVPGILTHETGHRWLASVHFQDPGLQTASSVLLEDDGLHWSHFLNTGASPLGGNQWNSLGGSRYQAVPVDSVEFSPLDLYLMGLLTAEEVAPLQFLVNAVPVSASSPPAFAALRGRVSEPDTVEAEVVEVSIDQIIAVEGRREPNIGFNARTIRQAWIYVYQSPTASFVSEFGRIQELQAQWDAFFSDATGGRAVMSTSLY